MLHERVQKALEMQKEIDQRKLARIAGVNESSISRYLHGLEELNFEAVFRIINCLLPEEEKELMGEYMLHIKSRNARYALEYCLMNNMTDHFEHLLELLIASANPVDKEWGRMYDILYAFSTRTVSAIESLKNVEVLKPKEIEMEILKALIKAYVYFEMNEHEALAIHIRGTEARIEEIKSTFMQEAFRARLGVILNYVYLYENNVQQSRHYSWLVINQDTFENVKGMAYHQLGHSYMFEDYERAKEFFDTAIKVFTASNKIHTLRLAQMNMSFLQSYWQIEREFSLDIDDSQSQSNYIFYLIQKGDLELAQKQLDQIDIASLSYGEQAFFYYYLGILSQDINAFYYSVNAFLHVGDYFHLQLPLAQLRKLGENEVVLEVLGTKKKTLDEQGVRNLVYH